MIDIALEYGYASHGCDLVTHTVESMSYLTDVIIGAYTADWGIHGDDRRYFCGIGVPGDYDGVVPQAFELEDVPAGYYQVVSHPPFEYPADNAEVMRRVERVAFGEECAAQGFKWKSPDHCYQQHYREEHGYMDCVRLSVVDKACLPCYHWGKGGCNMQAIRIYDMPPCRMAASPVGMFGDPAMDVFEAWMNAQLRTLFPRDFLTWDDSDPSHPGFRWYFQYDEGMRLPEGAEIIDFPGGMYAVATDIDQKTDKAAMDAAVAEFLGQHGLERDDVRRELGNIITSAAVREALGFEQMDYYYPVRAK